MIRPTIVGSGFLALDIVYVEGGERPTRLLAGGTAGNVLTIMAFLDWHSLPIGRLGTDKAGDLLLADMAAWGVDESQVVRGRKWATPIVVHRVYTAGKASARHRFEWRCPHCGAFLPRHRPITLKIADAALARVANPRVFFFDRATPAAVRLARHWRDSGTLIFFEPPATSGKFKESVEVAHIMKYSTQRLSSEDVPSGALDNTTIIETMAGKGVKYRLPNMPSWRFLDPPSPSRVADTAGAGDWTTAGILHALHAQGVNAEKLTRVQIESAVECGQILAALSVQSVGARGVMYDVDSTELRSAIEEAVRDLASPGIAVPDGTPSWEKAEHQAFCPQCV